jgi:hypothetical protein
MTEQEWITTSTGPGYTLAEICEDLGLDIEDLAQDPCVPLLHSDTDTMTHAEKIQEVLYDAYAIDAMVEIYEVTESGKMCLGMAKAKDVDIFRPSSSRGYMIEALLETGTMIYRMADELQVLPSGC